MIANIAFFSHFWYGNAMPITTSAKKALRGSKRKKQINDRNKKQVKEAIKKVERLAKEGKKADAAKLIPVAYAAIDKAAKRGVIKKNTAARRKSLVSRMVK